MKRRNFFKNIGIASLLSFVPIKKKDNKRVKVLKEFGFSQERAELIDKDLERVDRDVLSVNGKIFRYAMVGNK